MEIARLQFRVVGPVGESSDLPFDLRFSDGRFHTFLALDDGTTVLVDSDIATQAGRITIIAPQPGTFVCIKTFTTNDGEKEIRLPIHGQPLPCGKQHVCELAGLPVEIRDATGQVVLAGTVPALPGPCP
jgi:hypothetical protein